MFRYSCFWSRRPDKIKRSVQVGEFEFFQGEAGLPRMQRNGDRKAKEFNPFHAASSQGYMPPSSENLPKAARRFSGAGGRIWFGTSGFGILSYDVKESSVPSWQASVLYADADYVFAAVAGSPDASEPELCIYVIRDATWYQLESVPVQLLESAGYSGTVDHRPYLGMETIPTRASQVELRDGTTYVLRTAFSNGSETRIGIPVGLLAEAR